MRCSLLKRINMIPLLENVCHAPHQLRNLFSALFLTSFSATTASFANRSVKAVLTADIRGEGYVPWFINLVACLVQDLLDQILLFPSATINLSLAPPIHLSVNKIQVPFQCTSVLLSYLCHSPEHEHQVYRKGRTLMSSLK